MQTVLIAHGVHDSVVRGEKIFSEARRAGILRSATSFAEILAILLFRVQEFYFLALPGFTRLDWA